MLTRWGSILKVTHSVVTMGRTDGRRPVNGIPHSSRQKRVRIAAYADFKWTLAVVGCRSSDRDRLVCDIQLRECRWFFLPSLLPPEALFDFWPPS